MPDCRQRAEQADDPSRRHRARADVEHIGAADLVRTHLGDWNCPRLEHTGNVIAEELDQRNQHQVRQHAAGRGDGRNARADDVADAEQLGRDLDAHRAGRERRAKNLLRDVHPRSATFSDL